MDEGKNARVPGAGGRASILLAFSLVLGAMAASRAMAGLPTNGLMLHYSFDTDNGATVPDQSGGGNLGLVTTNLEWSAFGISKGAYRFHGSNEYITAGPMFNWTNFSEGFSLSFWTRQIETELRGSYWAGTTGGSGATTNRFELGANFSSQGEIFFRLYDDEGNLNQRRYAATGVDDGEWHHVAMLVSSNPADIRLLLDGVEFPATETSGTVLRLTGLNFPLVLGAAGDGAGGISSTNSLNAYLDEFRIFKRLLTTNEARVFHMIMEGEPDDTAAQARQTGPSQIKFHTFKSLADEDWLFFYTFTNYTNYVFSTKNLGTNVDTQLTIYRTLTNGALGLVTSVNHFAMGSGLVESWTLSDVSNDLYFVKISTPTGLYGGGGGGGPARRHALGSEDAGFGEGSEYESELSASPTPGVRIIYIAAPDNGGRQAGVWAKVDSTTQFFPSRNEGLAFSGVSEGSHTVEVGLKPGTRLMEHPSRPGQIGNINSTFGNPRWVNLTGSAMYTICVFRAEAMNLQQATVRDGYTGAHLSDAAVTCISDSAPFTGTESRRGHAYETSYQQLWRTLSDGSFPTNLVLYPTTWDLRLNRDGYVTRTFTDAVGAVAWGHTNDLGDLLLYPVDANLNGIADSWELAHFPPEAFPIDPAGDNDEDGLSNWAEYMANTDPTNGADRLDLTLTTENDTLRLRWTGQPWRRYRVGIQAVVSEEGWDSETDTVTHSGTSSWEQTWSDVNWLEHTQRVYRLEVLRP